MKKKFHFLPPISIHSAIARLALPLTIASATFYFSYPARAQSPAGDLRTDNVYGQFSHCIVNEYGEGSNSPREQAKCRGLLIESNRKVLELHDIKNGFTYFFYATIRKQDFVISYATDHQNNVKYIVISGDNFSFGGSATGNCEEYLRDSDNHIIVCSGKIIEDQLGNGASNNLVYAAAINLAETNQGLTTSQQSLAAQCTGAAIGSLLGLAITGNARAAANAIPTQCRQNSPSPQYQTPTNRNAIPNTHLNPNRRWLQDSMRDTDMRFIPYGDGWRDIQRNPSGFK